MKDVYFLLFLLYMVWVHEMAAAADDAMMKVCLHSQRDITCRVEPRGYSFIFVIISRFKHENVIQRSGIGR